MIKKVYQFVYDKSNPNNDFINGHLLDKYYPVTQLGIQTAPGVKFSINNGGLIEIGTTGIYELDLQGGLGQISSLNFDSNSIENFLKTNENYNTILVDIIYESQE